MGCCSVFCLILLFLLLASVAGVAAVWYMNYFDVHSLAGKTHNIGPYEVEIVVIDEPEEPVGPQPIENLAFILDEMYDSQ